MSKRTGTSNWNPAVTAALAGGTWPTQECHDPGRGVDGEMRAGRLFRPIHGNAYAAGHRLDDGPRIWRVNPAIGFDQLKRRGRAVANANRLIERRHRKPGRSRGMIEPVAPAKAVQSSAPFLEEGDHGGKRVERLDAIACVIAAARMRPARIALLAPGADRDDLGAALRSARAFQRDVEWKQDFVKGGHDDCSMGARRGTRARARGLKRHQQLKRGPPWPDAKPAATITTRRSR